MGYWLETDFVTRLAIREGEPVLMLFAYDRDGKRNHYNHGKDAISDTGIPCQGLLEVNEYNRILCFFGKYNDYGWIENLDDADRSKGVAAFMRKETYNFIKKEMKGTKGDHSDYDTKETLKKTNYGIAKELLKNYGYEAVLWGMAETMRRNPEIEKRVKNELRKEFHGISETNPLTDSQVEFMIHSQTLNNKAYLSHFCNKGLGPLWMENDVKSIEKYAKELVDIINPIRWYCELNRICIAGGIPFPHQDDNYGRIKRLSDFTLKQSRKLIKEYEDEYGEYDEE